MNDAQTSSKVEQMDTKDELILTALLKEFEARWQELQNLSNAVGTWTTIYATALFAAVAWMVSRPKAESLGELFRSKDEVLPYALICLCFVNILFFFAVTSMSYRIHEIALYIEERLAPRIRDLTDPSFNAWESYRRKSSAAWGRNLYALLQFSLPILLSIALIWLYSKHFWSTGEWSSSRNWLAYSTLIILILCVGASVEMSRDFQSRWSRVLTSPSEPQSHKVAPPPEPPSAPGSKPVGKQN